MLHFDLPEARIRFLSFGYICFATLRTVHSASFFSLYYDAVRHGRYSMTITFNIHQLV